MINYNISESEEDGKSTSMCTHTFLSLEATSSMTFCTSDSCLEAAAVLEDRDTPREREGEGGRGREREL